METTPSFDYANKAQVEKKLQDWVTEQKINLKSAALNLFKNLRFNEINKGGWNRFNSLDVLINNFQFMSPTEASQHSSENLALMAQPETLLKLSQRREARHLFDKNLLATKFTYSEVNPVYKYTPKYAPFRDSPFSVNKKSLEDYINNANNNSTSLHEVIKRRNPDVFHQLCKLKGRINYSRDSQGNTPPHIAITEGRIDMLKEL